MDYSRFQTNPYKAEIDQDYFDYLFRQNQCLLKPFGANYKYLRGYAAVPVESIRKALMKRTFRVRVQTVYDIELGVRFSVSASYLSALADFFGLTAFDIIVSDYSVFENIPERVRLTFNMKEENLGKMPKRRAIKAKKVRKGKKLRKVKVSSDSRAGGGK